MKRLILKVVLSTALISSVGFSQGLTLSGSDVKFGKKLSLKSLSSYSLTSEDISIVIKLKSSLTKDDEAKLYSAGAKAISYAGVNSYYVLATQSDVDAVIESIDNIDGVAVLKPEFKINKNLKDISMNDEVKVNITFLKDLDQSELEQLLNTQGIEYKELKVEDRSAKVKIYGVDIERVAQLAVVKEINKAHKISLIKSFSADVTTKALFAARQAKVTDDWKNTIGLDGANIPVAIVDEGKVLKSHREFTEGGATKIRDRVVNGSSSLHSTHIAGIIGAKGLDTWAKGIADGTQVYSFSYNDYSFATSISTLASRFGILVSNHSYGYSDKEELGVYNSDAASEDRLVYNNPYINVFMAAGNDRAYGYYPEIGIIKGAGNAKNIFTIGALDNNSNNPAYYTSTGPVNDFRIKPDLAVRGSSVYSTSNSGGYALQTGTSMASPVALALATLVMQEYKNITDCGNGVGCDMRHDLLKAVLIDGAIDKGVAGPDVYTGYGLIDVQKSVDAVKTIKEDGSKQVKLDIVGRGAVKEYSFTQYTGGRFTATLSWVDMAGNSASSGKSLVNDLDIYLIDDDGVKYYPYSLNKSDVTAPALSDRRNDVDNTEKIEVSRLPSGDYKLVVDASRIQSSTQEFAVASNSKIFDSFSNSISLKEDLAVDNFAKVMLESLY